MYCKCGSLDNARKVFDVMAGKDVVAWNSMIIGYGIHGFGDEALQLFHDMCYVEVKPSDITFVAALTTCVHAGLVSK